VIKSNRLTPAPISSVSTNASTISGNPVIRPIKAASLMSPPPNAPSPKSLFPINAATEKKTKPISPPVKALHHVIPGVTKLARKASMIAG